MKLELEPNMYVRTKEGYICKILKLNEPFEDDGYLDHNDIRSSSIQEKNVIKASHNIIDLIEVGDVIIDKEGHKYPINYEFETDYNNEYESYEITIDDHITLFFKDCLSIVTKEQMEAIVYKVGDSNE